MNRINKLFKEKGNNILSVYFTAGYPNLNDTVEIIRQLSSKGVDLIEIGVPFSDPLADGPVIQHSSQVALKNGMRFIEEYDDPVNVRTRVYAITRAQWVQKKNGE